MSLPCFPRGDCLVWHWCNWINWTERNLLISCLQIASPKIPTSNTVIKLIKASESSPNGCLCAILPKQPRRPCRRGQRTPWTRHYSRIPPPPHRTPRHNFLFLHQHFLHWPHCWDPPLRSASALRWPAAERRSRHATAVAGPSPGCSSSARRGSPPAPCQRPAMEEKTRGWVSEWKTVRKKNTSL